MLLNRSTQKTILNSYKQECSKTKKHMIQIKGYSFLIVQNNRHLFIVSKYFLVFLPGQIVCNQNKYSQIFSKFISLY